MVRPKRLTPGELKKVGVNLLDKGNIRLKCERCGMEWSPNLKEGGKLPGNYWRCPNGCNANQ
jgi:hypothetical protein